MDETSDYELTIAEAAWLLRVNDDTVRGWIRRGRRGKRLVTTARGTVLWATLARFAPDLQPLHPSWLSVTARDPLPEVWRQRSAQPHDAVEATSEALAELGRLRARVAELETTGLALKSMIESALPALGQRLIGDTFDI